jgi:hypothetical protein
MQRFYHADLVGERRNGEENVQHGTVENRKTPVSEKETGLEKKAEPRERSYFIISVIHRA